MKSFYVEVVERQEATPWGTRIISITPDGEVLSIRYLPNCPDQESPGERQGFAKPIALGSLAACVIYGFVKVVLALLP